MRTLLVVTLAGTGVLFRPASAGQQADAAALVAAAREALGGDTALRAVASFMLDGSVERRLPQITVVDQVEISCVLPDKFLQVTRKYTSGPINFEIVEYAGFNGDVPIRASETTGPVPLPPSPNPIPVTPDEIAAARARELKSGRRTFMQRIVPLFIAVPAAYAQTVSAGGKVALSNGLADAIDMTSPDIGTWRLLLDEKTHLPIKIAWRAKPIVTFSTTTMSTMTVRNGTPVGAPSTPPPVVFPTGDPTAGLADVDWEMTIGEYKVADGLNWPHRLTTTYDGRKWEDAKIGKYKINPKIDPKRFDKKWH